MTAKFFRLSAPLLVFGVLLSMGAGVCRAQYDEGMPQPPPSVPAQNPPSKAAPAAPKINKAEEDAYKALTHDDLFDVAARHGVHFDQTRQTGVVFHMMNAIGEEGLLGLTAVAIAGRPVKFAATSSIVRSKWFPLSSLC